MFKVIYLWLIKLVSLVFYFKKRMNVVYVMSFSNNLDLIEKIARAMPNNRKLIVFYTNDNQRAVQKLNDIGIETIYFNNNLYFVLVTLPILLSAKLIFCDNYFPFLGGLKLPPNVKIVQLWHADGAVKRFGWGDPKTHQRSASAKSRFQSVYNHFNQFVVASKAMGSVFTHSYRVPSSRMKLLGYPRSDRFFDPGWIAQSQRKILRVIPQLRNHRVILYAPTYRKGVTFKPPKGLREALTSDPKAITLVRLHPALKDQYRQIEDQIGRSSRLMYLEDLPTDELLTVTDTLVTDYSSVAFDFSLLPNAKSMIFFMYDLDRYRREPGCQRGFLKWLPSRPVTTVKQLALAILAKRKDNFSQFNQHWNTCNDGHAAARVINYYINPLKRRH